MDEDLISKELINKIFDEFYTLEDYFEYDETPEGRRIGKLINELQNTLIK